MTLARVSGSLTKPWSLVSGAFDDTFGSGVNDGPRCVWSTAFYVYVLTVTADRSTGRVEVTVSTGIPYSLLAVIATFLTFVVAANVNHILAAMVALAVCFPLAVIPLIPGMVHFQRFYDRFPDLIDAENSRITPFVLFPFVGIVFSMWLVATSTLVRVLILLLAAFLLVYVVYAVGFVPESLRRQQSIFALAFFSGFPLLLTAGNLGLVRVLSDGIAMEHVPYFVLILCGSTLVLIIIYSFLCRFFVRAMSDIPNGPITSPVSKMVWFGYFFSLNALSLVFLVALLTDVWRFNVVRTPSDTVNAGFQTVGVPFPNVLTAFSVTVLVLPLIGLVALWCVHLLRQFEQYRRISTASAPNSAIQSRYPIRLLETVQPVAYAAQTVPGKDVIVLSDTLSDELDEAELNAVLAHEEYHIQNGDLEWNLFASLVGVVVGGKNLAVVAHDYPQVERDADRYAAKRHGTTAIVSALRSVEQLQTETASPRFQIGKVNHREKMPWLLSAPYDVLFGSVIMKHAHASVDERIESVLTSVDNEL